MGLLDKVKSSLGLNPSSHPHDRMGPKKFLIVDDNVLLTKSLSTFFRHKGHACEWLNHPSHVEAWLVENNCDAIILDLLMPGIDGLSLLARIREKYPDLPVVIFTGMGYDEEKMQKGRDLGANGFVSKSLPPSELYNAIMRTFV